MKPNILYIEDHPDNMMLVRRILRPDRFNLIEAKSGFEGITIAENQAIDLVLLDIDSYEIARRLRASAKTMLAHPPIIVVTANAMEGDAQKALAAGADVYMSKPINIQELLEKVEGFVFKEAQGLKHVA